MRAKTTITVFSSLCAVLLAAFLAADALALGGPVIIGGDDADDHGHFSVSVCEGCGPQNELDGLCTNTCTDPVTCGDPARTIDAGGPGTEACKQFDSDSRIPRWTGRTPAPRAPRAARRT